jgi:hypothetical protein
LFWIVLALKRRCSSLGYQRSLSPVVHDRTHKFDRTEILC